MTLAVIIIFRKEKTIFLFDRETKWS